MTAAEIAALITACGVALAGIITSIAAVISARNSAVMVDRLKDEIRKLHEHNEIQDAALIERESIVNRLTMENRQQKKEIESLQNKIAKWQEWGVTVGRMMNEMQLEIGFLTHSKSKTGPLPSFPNTEQE